MCVAAVCVVPGQVAEPPKKEPLIGRVRRAIDRGVEYLRRVDSDGLPAKRAD